MVQMKYTQLLVMFMSSCIVFSKAIAVPLTPSLGSGSALLEIEDQVTQIPHSQLQVESVTNAIENALNKVMQSLQSATSIHTSTLTGELCSYVNRTLQSLAGEGKIKVIMNVGLENLDLELNVSEVGDSASTNDDVLFGEVIDGKTVSISELVPGISSSLDPILQTVKLKTLLYNCNDKILSVESLIHGEHYLIPGVISLQNVTLSFMTNAHLLSPVFNFSGEWVIAGISFTLDIQHDSNSRFQIVGRPKQSDIDFEQFVRELTGRDLPLDTEISIGVQNLMVEANLDSETAVISAELGEDIKAFLILQRSGIDSNNFIVALAIEFVSSQLSTVIEKVTGLDISAVPYFGTLRIPGMGITISPAKITKAWLTEALSSSPLLSKAKGTISEGVTGFVEVDFMDSILEMRYCDSNLNFDVHGESLNVSTLISILPSVNLQSLSLPPGLNQINNLHVTSFSLLTEARKISIEVSLPRTLTYFNNILVVSEPSMVITASYPNLDICLAVSGNLTLAGINIDVAIAKQNSTYVLTASTDEINFANIIEGFAADILPRELRPILTAIPLTQVVISEMTMKLPLTLPSVGGPQQIYVSGVPSLTGFTLGEINAIIVRETSGVVHVIEAIELPSINLANFLGQLIPLVSFDSIPFINQDLDIDLVLSPKTLPNIKLFGEKFRDLDIIKGVSLQTQLSFPSGCSLDPFCVVARYLLNTDSFNLHGIITNSRQFTLRATVDDISVGSALTISEAGIEIQMDESRGASIGIGGVIELSSPSLTFQSRVFFSTVTSEVVLEMTMSGCWENALGITFLDICNLHASSSFTAGATLSRLSLGGRVSIGKQSCGRVITATGYVGINAASPTQNYFYADINSEVTIPSLLEAFCISIPQLPRPLSQTGFPNGFRTSFSLIGIELPRIPLSIPQGFHFKGAVNLLGLQVQADITISLPEGLNATIELPVLDAGSLLRMYRSSSNQSQGPILRALIHAPSNQVDIEASGYLSTLGISLETTMHIKNDTYEFTFSGCILSLFEVDLVLSAPYGPFSLAGFQVSGSFKSDLFSQIEDLIKDVLEKTANAASRAVDEAQDFLNGRVRELRAAESALESARSEVDDAERIFDSAVREVNELKDRLDRVCSKRSCGSVCVGCFSGTTCCGRVWGRCVCVLPKWKSCCWRVSDPVCESKNAACELLKAPIRTLLEAARTTLDSSRRSLDVVRIALRAAEEVLSGAQEAVELASDALEVVEDTYQVGMRAATKIAQFGLTGIVNIQEITFSRPLSVVSTGSFSVSIRTRILGAETTVGVSLNLRDVTGAARELGDRVTSGLSNFF